MRPTDAVCADCKSVLPLKACMSAAGHYAGYVCPKCGPYGRVSGYVRTAKEAQAEVDAINRVEDALDDAAEPA